MLTGTWNMLVMGKLFYNGMCNQITVIARPTRWGITGKLLPQGNRVLK